MRNISKIVITLIFTVVLTSLSLGTTTASADIYSSYKQLASKQTKNEDYRITSNSTPSNTAVIAIHGGKIEVGTCNIAKTVAQKINSNLYVFEGIKSKNNNILHITSSNFDEPLGQKIVAKSTQTLAIHGCRGTATVTYIGGKDKALGAKIKSELKKVGFKTAISPENLAGTHPNNIVNKNQIKKGVQLELTYNMRQALLKDNALHTKYVNALSQALK